MADRQMAGELLQAGLGEHLWHQAHVLVTLDPGAVGGHDSRTFLAPVLQGVQPEIRQLGRILVAENPANAAFVGGPVGDDGIDRGESMLWHGGTFNGRKGWTIAGRAVPAHRVLENE